MMVKDGAQADCRKVNLHSCTFAAWAVVALDSPFAMALVPCLWLIWCVFHDVGFLVVRLIAVMD
jgi:hypothetical protein